MIVCLCKGISSRTILTEIRQGNGTVRGIARACEAGTCCGACVPQIRDMVRSHGAPVHARTETVQPPPTRNKS